MTLPQVSIVMGVYNGRQYLREAVESILAQEDVDFEFIIIDDGSTDGIGQILDEYAAQDKRIRVFHQENVGLTKALIRGCAEAKGAFIARQDADDVSLPGRLRMQHEMLSGDENLAFVSCWADWIGPAGEFLFAVTPAESPADATRKILYEKAGPPAHGTVMFRRQAYLAAGGYRGEFHFAQDSDLWRRLGHVGQIGYVQKVLYRYRVGLENISGTKSALQAEFDRLAHACHHLRLAGRDESSLLVEAAGLRSTFVNKGSSASSMAYFIGRCLVGNRDRRAITYLWQAVRTRPWHLRSWFFLLLANLSGRGVAPKGER